MGTPTNTAFTTVRDAVEAGGGNLDAWKAALTLWTAIGQAVGAFVILIVGQCVLVKLFGKNKSFKDVIPVIPFCIFVAACFDVVYLLIWLTRWVGWFSEVEAIREKLGLTPAPSPLKWREVLPYLLLLGAVNALAMPLLHSFEGHYPVLTGFLLPFIIYPILAGAVGFHTGKHCGFTALVPIAVYLLSLLNDFWLWMAKVLSVANMAYGYVRQGLDYAAIALVFHLLGVLVRRQRISRNEKKGGRDEKTS